MDAKKQNEDDETTGNEELNTSHLHAGVIGASGKSEQVYIRIEGGVHVVAPLPSSVYIEKIESLRNVILARATGEGGDGYDYEELREELIRDEYIKPLLPRFVITNPTLSQFSAYIKAKFRTYRERREYIWSEFQGLLSGLERGNLAYVTEEDEKPQPLQSVLEKEETPHVATNELNNNYPVNTKTKVVTERIKILFLAANPFDTSRLRLAEEVRTIDERLRMAQFRERFDIIQHHAVRITDLSELLMRHKPHIVHFSGHSSSKGQIILEDVTGKAEHVTAGALAQLFRILKDNIRCVVLNACFSISQANEIAKYIESVIGTSQAIGDEAAIRFAGGFYRAIGYGRSIETAFEIGCNEIGLASIVGEEDTPQLLNRNDTNPANIHLIENVT